MQVGPITTTVVDLQTNQKMTSIEFTQLRRQGKIKPGIYPYIIPGVGHSSAEYRVVPMLNELSHSKKIEVEYLLDRIFEEILEEEPHIVKIIEALFDDKPELRFYAIQYLQKSQFSGPARFSIFKALLKAKAPFFLWHSESAEELYRLLRTYGVFLANVPYLSGFNGLSQCFMQFSEKGLVDAFHKFGLLLQFDANLDHMHPQSGTVFHSFTADEAEDIVIQLLKLCKMLGKKPNLNLRDFEGKTVLFLAAKTRQPKLVQELIKLKREGFAIDLDLPDKKGRTPIMMSAALGDKKSYECLVEAGANINAKDNQGRDFQWYLNAGVEIINPILLEIQIDPQRDPRVKANWLRYNDEYAHHMVCSKSKEKYQRVLNSSLPAHKNLIDEILAFAYLKDRSLYDYILNQIAPWYGKPPASMQSFCLEGKVELKEWLNEKLRMHCALGNLTEVMKYCSLGASPSATDKLGRNAFHYCVMREKLVQTLKSKHPAYHARSIKDCMDGHVTCFRFLLDKGDLFQKNIKNNTVEDILQRDKVPHSQATELDTQTAQSLYFVYYQHIFTSEAQGILVGDPHTEFNQLSLKGSTPDIPMLPPLESNEKTLLFDVRRSLSRIPDESADLGFVPSFKRVSLS